jgi:hypothetical protein
MLSSVLSAQVDPNDCYKRKAIKDDKPVFHKEQNNLPDSIFATGEVVGVVPGICGTFCFGGSIKVKLNSTIKNYPYPHVYLAVGCADLSHKCKRTISFSATKLLESDKKCTHVTVSNTFDDNDIPFYVINDEDLKRLTFSNTDLLKLQVDSLKYISGDPFVCNSVTWRIIANKKEAIQILIDKLGDTTLTKATDKCKTSNLRVGDLAYLTLVRVLPLPFMMVTGMQCDVMENGCQLGVFEYIEKNRSKFKGQVQAYYDKKKSNLKWRQLDSNKLTPCYIKNNIKGHYE